MLHTSSREPPDHSEHSELRCLGTRVITSLARGPDLWVGYAKVLLFLRLTLGPLRHQGTQMQAATSSRPFPTPIDASPCPHASAFSPVIVFHLLESDSRSSHIGGNTGPVVVTAHPHSPLQVLGPGRFSPQ